MSQNKDQTIRDGKPPMKPGRKRGLPQKRCYDTRSARQQRYMRLRRDATSSDDEELDIQMQWSGDLSTIPGSSTEPQPQVDDSSRSHTAASNVAASSSHQFQFSDVEGLQVASEDDSTDGADAYNFAAVQEDAPMDACPYGEHFEQPLNQSADEYVMERRIEQARRERMELFMYSLSAANQDEVYEIEDIKRVLESELIEQGVESLVITPDLTINYTQRRTVTTERGKESVLLTGKTKISPDEVIPEDETVILNGLPLPHIQPPTADIKVAFDSTNHEEEKLDEACQLCVHADVAFQLRTRHRSEATRHAMLHGMEIPIRPSARFEDTFSPDVTLENSTYNREYNFLPTANSFDEAVNIIMADDSPLPAARLDKDDLIGNVIVMIRHSTVYDLLWFYACLLLTNFLVKGNTIRHVYHCNGR